ncbi:MAG: phage major capsid protein, partial [Clostridia bacterium]|nr:phage major capsid protein [Clostridia bacterium]
VTTGANPGNGFLPITVSNTLIDDIYGDEGFLSAITHSQIKGLRLPKAKTTVTQTTAAVPAGTAATEHSFDDDAILFGRFPGRDKILVPGSVMRGTNVDLAGYIQAKLNEIHQERIYNRMFATGASGDYAHMSLYNAATGIAEVSGATTYEAICAALSALKANVRAVAKVAMTPMAYFAMIKELSNGAATLFGTPDKAMLGFNVVLCEYATQPLVGDLKTIRVNYDDALFLKTDEDIDNDVIKFVINGDYDIQVEDANRLRRVKVAA